MDKVDLYLGRFQPPHNGHLAVIESMKNRPIVVIVRGKQSSQDKNRNPFDEVDQQFLLRRIVPGIETMVAENGYLPDIIQTLEHLGSCPDTVYAGPDRIGQYRAQVERANKTLETPLEIKFVETERVTSASVVREAIRSGDEEAFKANVPRAIWDQYPTMKEKVTNND